MLICLGGFDTTAVDPCICLIGFYIIGQGFSRRKIITRFHCAGVDIAVSRMILQIIGIARDGTGLSPLVFGPRIVSRIGNRDDTFPLIVEDIAQIHIQSGFVFHRDICCTVRRQDPAVTSAGNPARQIDLATLGIDILHYQLIRGRIPIDLRHVIKDFIRAVPLGTAIIDLVHGTVLDNGCPSGRSYLRCIQLRLRHRSGIVLVAALNQAIHVDVSGRHIDIPPGNIARSLLRSAGALIVAGCFLAIRARFTQVKILLHRSSLIRQILLRIAVDIDNAIFVVLSNGAVGRDKADRVTLHARRTLLGATADADISAGVSDGHIAVEIADLAVHFHIGDSRILQLPGLNVFFVLFLFIRCQIAAVNLLFHLCGQRKGARLPPAERFGVVQQQPRHRAIGSAIDFTESSPVTVDIDCVDFCISSCRAWRNDIIFIKDNAAPLLAHDDVIQFQIGIRVILDGDGWSGIGMERPRADEVISLHIDIASTGGNIGNLHIVNGTAGIDIARDIALFIPLHQS